MQYPFAILFSVVWFGALGMSAGDALPRSLPANCLEGAHFRTSRPFASDFLCTTPGTWVRVGPIGSTTSTPSRALVRTDSRRNAGTGPKVVSVRDFGAKGDGVTDDYSALQAAAAFICRVPGATLRFPPGTYHIGRYRIVGGSSRNNVANIRYIGCRGVTLSGEGATIDVFGGFRRTADFRTGGFSGSYSVGVTPFEMIDSSNFRIAGFEIRGNVDKMTRDPNVAEGDNAGILTTRCRDYIIEDVTVHHFHTDGIKLGGNALVADQGALLRGVKSTNNGRLGLAVIQVRNATIENSTFAATGRTGEYGVHDPGAGVDIEPNRTVPAVDVNTGNINFEQCHFEDNIGPQFVAMWSDRVESSAVRRSTIRAMSPDSSPLAFLNAPATGQVSDNRFEVGHGRKVALTCPKRERCKTIVRLTYERNEFILQDRAGLYSSDLQNSKGYLPVDFLANRISVLASRPEYNPILIADLDKVKGNSFFIGANGYGTSRKMGAWAVAYANVNAVQNNRYDTDLAGERVYLTVYSPRTYRKAIGEVFTSRNFKANVVAR